MSEPVADRRQRSSGTAADRAAPSTATPSTRHDRARLVAFVSDAKTEEALREGLTEALPGGAAFHRGSIRQAIATLRKMPTPVALIVDLTGEDAPLVQLAHLSEVVEPSVQVLVIGEVDTLEFYREVTRGLGVMEYLPKPLSREAVRRHFLPMFVETPTVVENIATGRVISVTGSRGGVGATTIAANLAWYFGVTAARHTALLDPDLHLGSAAMLLDAATGSGLRIALEAPERVDPLFVERAAQPVSERLHVLAGEVRLNDQIAYAPDCAQSLLNAMCNRYAVIVADNPLRPMTLFQDIFALAHQRVLVTVPTLASVRDTRRMLAMQAGPSQSGRALVVLNRAGLRGGLTRLQVEDALGLKVDLVIPDMPKLVETAASMGQALADKRNPFGRAITDLARQTAFVRLLDSPLQVAAAPASRKWWRLFG